MFGCMCLLLNDCFVLHAHSSQDGSAYVRASRQECVVPPPPLPSASLSSWPTASFLLPYAPCTPTAACDPSQRPRQPAVLPQPQHHCLRLAPGWLPQARHWCVLVFVLPTCSVACVLWMLGQGCSVHSDAPALTLSPSLSLSVSGLLRKHVLTRPPLSFTGLIDMQAWRP